MKNDFIISMNAFKEGLGGSLMKEGHVAYYESSKPNEHEKSYVTHDLELATIMHDALKMWRNYLLGIKFVLMIDHGGLRCMFDCPKLNSKQTRWLALISKFYFDIKYIKGKENKVVDALSSSLQEVHLEAMSAW